TIQNSRSVIDQSAGRAQRLTARADVDVVFGVISELLAREGAIASSRSVEQRHVRLDPLLIDEPTKHLRRTVGAIAEKAFWAKVEAIPGPFEHALCSQHFRLTDCRGRLDIHDDRVLGIDKIV